MRAARPLDGNPMPVDWEERFRTDEKLNAMLSSLPTPRDTAVKTTLVISAFLTGATNVHSGFFGVTPRDLRAHVEELVAASPGLCNSLGTGSRLLVLHDQPASWRPRPSSGIELMQVTRDARSIGNDRRWLLFERALRGDAQWDCAYAIDLTDVRVINVPPCVSLSGQLVVLSDDTHHCCRRGVKRWLALKAASTRFNETWSDELHRFVGGRYEKHRLWNCGVVGGRRDAFLPALADATAKLRAHWRRYPSLREPGLDSLVWTEIALQRHASGSPTISGYPFGPANLPVNLVGPWAHVTQCPRPCRVAFLNVTRRRFWFAHKAAPEWIRLLMRLLPCASSPRLEQNMSWQALVG